jgi:hypothetical protein
LIDRVVLAPTGRQKAGFALIFKGNSPASWRSRPSTRASAAHRICEGRQSWLRGQDAIDIYQYAWLLRGMMDWLPDDDIVHLVVGAVELMVLGGSRRRARWAVPASRRLPPPCCWRC